MTGSIWLDALWVALVFSYGWGVRGTITGAMRGAMVAGGLIGLALAIQGEGASGGAMYALAAAGAIGFSFGGSMTYGQTLGLTQDGDPPSAYAWGMLGTCVKGSVWIGLGALVMGMAASSIEYSLMDGVILIIIGPVLWALGIRIFNRPMAPPARFPAVYFSKRDATGRAEWWGGMWVMFAGWLGYAYLVRGDGFAAGLAMFGLVGGGIGFPFGQALHSWGSRKAPLGKGAQAWIDWWKVMEFTFGAVAGLALSLGWTVLGRRFPLSPLDLSPEWSTISIATALVWLAVFLYVYIRLRPQKDPYETWWFFALHLFAPLPGVLAGDFLWTVLFGCSMLFWVVGYTVPLRWPTEGRERAVRRALWAFVAAVVGVSLLLGFADAWTSAALLGALVVFYSILLGFTYRLSDMKRSAEGRRRTHSAFTRATPMVFLAQTVLILWALVRL